MDQNLDQNPENNFFNMDTTTNTASSLTAPTESELASNSESTILSARLSHIMDSINGFPYGSEPKVSKQEPSKTVIEKQLRKQLIEVLIESEITPLNKYFFEIVDERKFFEVSVFEVILALYRDVTNRKSKVEYENSDLNKVIEFLRQNVGVENRRGRKRKDSGDLKLKIAKIGEFGDSKTGSPVEIASQDVSTKKGGSSDFNIDSNLVPMKKRGGKVGHTKTVSEEQKNKRMQKLNSKKAEKEVLQQSKIDLTEPETIEIDEADQANNMFDDLDLTELAAPMTPSTNDPLSLVLDDQINNVLNSPNMFNSAKTNDSVDSPLIFPNSPAKSPKFTTLTSLSFETEISTELNTDFTPDTNSSTSPSPTNKFNQPPKFTPEKQNFEQQTNQLSNHTRPPPPAMIRLLEEATGKRPKTKIYGPKAFGNLSLPFHLDLGQYLNADTGETDQRVEVLANLSGKIGDTYDKQCNENDSRFYESCEFTRRKKDEFPF